MTKALKWKIAILLAIVFLAGVATGLLGAAHHARRIFWERHSEHLGGRMREHLRRELDLTPEQFAKIGPIIDQMSERLDAIRVETSKRVSKTMNESHNEIVPLLTPEQRTKLEKLKERHQHILRLHEPPGPPPPDAP